MLTLLLPDIHHRVDQADQIIRHVKPDKVIALGDVFDDFYDTPDMVRHSAEWFVEFVNNPRNTFIAGNHEMSYFVPQSPYRCSGYEQWKYFIISDIVSNKDWAKMKFYHILDQKWFLCHGGLHKNHLPKRIADLHANRPLFLKELSKALDAEIIKGRRGDTWIFNAGHARGGYQRVGGLTWCDFSQELYPIKGLNSIVGHTPQQFGCPTWCILEDDRITYHLSREWMPEWDQLDDTDKSFNICLDVWKNTTWATWDGTKLTLFNAEDDLCPPNT